MAFIGNEFYLHKLPLTGNLSNKKNREAVMESIWSKTCEIPEAFTAGQVISKRRRL